MKHQSPIGIAELARRLKLPIRWLKDEARGGRLPHITVGRRMLFNEQAVRAVLAKRAAGDALGLDLADSELLAAKAAKLCRHRLFRHSEQPDIEQELRIYLWVKSRLFDPTRGTPEAFAAMACDSWGCQEIRRRSRQKRVGDFAASSLDDTLLESGGDLLSLDRVLTAADLDRRHQRATTSPTEQIDQRDAIDRAMEQLSPGVQALLWRVAEVGSTQAAREMSQRLGRRVTRHQVDRIVRAARPFFENARNP